MVTLSSALLIHVWYFQDAAVHCAVLLFTWVQGDLNVNTNTAGATLPV